MTTIFSKENHNQKSKVMQDGNQKANSVLLTSDMVEAHQQEKVTNNVKSPVTIFTKEIERLEKKVINFPRERAIEWQVKLETLKQAEQKHLEFVKELKKEFKDAFTYLPKNMQGLLLDLNECIDNLSKGDLK